MSNLSLKATAIGSLPHKDVKTAVDFVFETFKDIPFWAQLAGVSRKEDMTVQYVQGIPGIKFDEENEKYYYDSQSEEFFTDLEEFFMDYETIVNEKDFSNLDKYAVTPPFSSSIPLFLEKLKNYDYAKGHIIGPFTWGTSLCDSDNLCAFYDETYREVLIKGLTLKAVWQIEQFKKASPSVTPIIFIDEPVMSQYGTSAFITIRKEDIVEAIAEISNVIKDFGALCAVHCCGKSDWSILIDAGVDIINFDAFLFSKSLEAYIKEVEKFLRNGGYLAFGLVPTLDKEALQKVTLEELENKFEEIVENLCAKGKIEKDLILKQSFLTPSCGAGSLSTELAQKAMELVNRLSESLQSKYGMN